MKYSKEMKEINKMLGIDHNRKDSVVEIILSIVLVSITLLGLHYL